MIVTLQDSIRLMITLRTWDGCNWSPDIAGGRVGNMAT